MYHSISSTKDYWYENHTVRNIQKGFWVQYNRNRCYSKLLTRINIYTQKSKIATNSVSFPYGFIHVVDNKLITLVKAATFSELPFNKLDSLCMHGD